MAEKTSLGPVDKKLELLKHAISRDETKLTDEEEAEWARLSVNTPLPANAPLPDLGKLQKIMAAGIYPAVVGAALIWFAQTTPQIIAQIGLQRPDCCFDLTMRVGFALLVLMYLPIPLIMLQKALPEYGIVGFIFDILDNVVILALFFSLGFEAQSLQKPVNQYFGYGCIAALAILAGVSNKFTGRKPRIDYILSIVCSCILGVAMEYFAVKIWVPLFFLYAIVASYLFQVSGEKV